LGARSTHVRVDSQLGSIARMDGHFFGLSGAATWQMTRGGSRGWPQGPQPSPARTPDGQPVNTQRPILTTGRPSDHFGAPQCPGQDCWAPLRPFWRPYQNYRAPLRPLAPLNWPAAPSHKNPGSALGGKVISKSRKRVEKSSRTSGINEWKIVVCRVSFSTQIFQF